MSAVNQCVFIGNLGKDAEMKYLPAGTAVTTFSIAVNNEGRKNDPTLWMQVEIYGKQAETANEHLTKGMLVSVSGRLKAFEFDGKDEKKVKGVRLNADSWHRLEKLEKAAEEGTLESEIPEIGSEGMPF